MTITQLIQSSPATANELFSKLAATTAGAVKTRESLFSHLKAELELHSRLEEEHLFPALRKHQETKEIVRAAAKDNKRTRALLSELDAMPKEGEEFSAKLAELRKAFQRHVRDEKKELLPAVKTALSKEEAQAISERVESDKTALEESKRQEAEERRVAARREREKIERRRSQAEARQRRAREEKKRHEADARAEERRARDDERQHQAELEADHRRARQAGAALAQGAESLIRDGQSVAATGGAAVLEGTESVVRSSLELAGAASSALGETGALVANAFGAFSDRLPTMESPHALPSLAPTALFSASEAGKAWFKFWTQTVESRGRRSFDLLHCLTPQQMAQVQTRYFGEAMQAWLEANTRILDISVEAYRGVMQPIDQAGGLGEARKPA